MKFVKHILPAALLFITLGASEGVDALVACRAFVVHTPDLNVKADSPAADTKIVLDTNLIQALIEDALGVSYQPGRISFAQTIKSYFDAIHIDRRSNVFSRLSTTHTLLSEITKMDNGTFSSKLEMLPGRSSQSTVTTLQTFNVGGGSAVADRQIISELIESARMTDGHITFMTADRKLINGLCRLSKICVDPARTDIRRFFPAGFEVELDGITIQVIPVTFSVSTEVPKSN